MTIGTGNDMRVVPDTADAGIEEIVAHATEQQRIASDPSASAWVSAAAGSGKTKVLTDRILRLLLPREDGTAGTAPEKILALTFTKAGASEMALRLSRRLSDWVSASDETLSNDIETALTGHEPTREQMDAARRLFARVVETPGGLRIMTIHSFCQSVLGRFPVESGLPPDFQPLEEAEAKAILARARQNVILRAGHERGSALAEAVDFLAGLLNEEQFSSLLNILSAERHQIGQVLARSFGADGAYASLCQRLDVTPNRSYDDIVRAFCDGCDENALRTACGYLAQGKKSDIETGLLIQAFFDSVTEQKIAGYISYSGTFLTQKGTPRAKLATNDVIKAFPEIVNILSNEAERIIDLHEEIKAAGCCIATRHLLIIAEHIINEYKRLKDHSSRLDFDDMILHTLSLLKGELPALGKLEATPWVMYKLDEGIEHILVDEAQDTNPEQWDIIRLLAEEFYAGYGAVERPRTLFVVGDEKQSIFGFQRAAQEKFGEMFRLFQRKVLNSGNDFHAIDITTSFRSVHSVLEAVDTIFDDPVLTESLTTHYLPHRAKRQGQAGLVELWPVVTDDPLPVDEDSKNPETILSDGWYVPDKVYESRTGSEKLGNKIGDTIKNWLSEKECLASYDRPIRPGDIMILVKSRNRFVSQMVRALKARNIPVSGIDRIVLSKELIIQDLCAAARFALLPTDDLILAGLLKSPFIGLTEDELFGLAYKRGHSLWHSLQASGHTAVKEWLSRLIANGANFQPYEFFSHILQEPCPADAITGLRAVRKRLGEDALDPIDEFLNIALLYEQSNCTSLQDFVEKHADNDASIKRELDESQGAVRIMTVHASKGLQAPVVFLPDTVHARQGNGHTPHLLWPDKTGWDVPVYMPNTAYAPAPALAARQKVMDAEKREYKRLLYVAATRAEERLYICGHARTAPSGPVDCWYDYASAAFNKLKDRTKLQALPFGIRDENGEEQSILRFAHKATAAPDKVKSGLASRKDSEPLQAMPEWLTATIPEEPFPPAPLIPSRPEEAEPIALSPRQSPDLYRFRRGIITHKLLQILPDIDIMARDKAIDRYLETQARDVPEAVRLSISLETRKILNDPTFGAVFGPGSLSEIPVTALLDGRILSGQIDRILIQDSDILIVDFKTNRPSPETEDAVPSAYRRQLQAYANAMRAIYPDHRIRAALLWTDSAKLMEINIAPPFAT